MEAVRTSRDWRCSSVRGPNWFRGLFQLARQMASALSFKAMMVG